MIERPPSDTNRSRSGDLDWLGDLAFLVPALLLSFALAYPIYEAAWFLVVVGVGLIGGTVNAWVTTRRRLSVWVSVAVGAATYILLGLPVASPEVFWAPNKIINQFVGVLVAPLAGPRQILTLDVPLGTYQQVLAPVFFLAIGVSLAVFNLAWRGTRTWFAGAPLVLVPMIWGIAFGTTSRGSLFDLPAPLHWVGSRGAIGGATVLLLFAWLSWRPWLKRRRRVRGIRRQDRGEDSPGRWNASMGLRLTLGVLMVTFATLVSAAATPLLMAQRSREVLREDVPVRVEATLEISPLSTYRRYFGEGVFEATMFAVTETSGLERVQIAALDYFDGSTFQATSPQSTQIFQRVPSTISPTLTARQESLRPVTTTVRIGEYQQPWVPLPGTLGSVLFEGEQKAELADNFFYNRGTTTGIQGFGDGIPENTSYRVDAWNLLASTAAIVGFVPARQGSVLVSDLPDSLVKWVDNQTQVADGAGLVELITRLRARGYLSHSLLEDDAGTWTSALGPDYRFQASRSGHSLDRISRLFVGLNEQEAAAGPNATAEQLVGAVGDDEQFAVAAALIADHLGFNVRVVVGARLQSDTSGELPACIAGICAGGDMAAWIEVQNGDGGAWAPLDVTPQHSLLLAPRTQQTSDPKNATKVMPAQIQVMPPPQAQPSGGETLVSADDATAWETNGLPQWLRVVGAVALGLLALATPPLTIIAAKTLRAWRRRAAPLGSTRIRGAWDEYADTARDYRYSVQPSSTRMETAMQLSFEDDSALHLAHAADYVSFRAPAGADFDSAVAWALVRDAKANLAVGTTLWQRVRSRLSPRSFRRGNT